MGKKIFILSTIIIVVLFAFSCKKYTIKVDEVLDDNIVPSKNLEIDYVSIIDNIYQEQEIWDILRISSYIMDKCRNATFESNAIGVFDSESFCSQIGLSENEYIQLNNVIKTSFDTIVSRYPQLCDVFSSESDFYCEDCVHGDNIDEKLFSIIQNFNNNPNLSSDVEGLMEYAIFNGNNSSSTTSVANDCSDYFNYTMCLLCCLSTGPYLYWICGYLCLCQFCPDFCIQI